MGRGPGVRAVGPEAIQIDFRWKGQRCRERLRLKPTAANLRFAANLKARIEHEIATGTFDYARHFPDSPRCLRLLGGNSEPKLSAYLARYIEDRSRGLQPETTREYRQSAETLVEGIGDPFIRNLTRADIRKWIASSPLSKKRLDNLLTPLRGALAQAVDDGILEKNPLHGFTFRRISEKREIDPFTPEEVEALGKTALGDLWTFWAWTGLRSGEIAGLRWSDVSDCGGIVSVRRSIRLGREKAPKTETGKRILHLLDPAKSALPTRGLGEPDRPLWTNPNTGNGWHEAKALNRAFRRACRDAGVRFRYVYQLRHSFASRALSSGENPLWVSAYLGHRDRTMVWRTYGRWIPTVDPLAGSKMVGAKAE